MSDCALYWQSLCKSVSVHMCETAPLSVWLPSRWMLPSPLRSATCPRCSRTVMRTQPTSSLSRCRIEENVTFTHTFISSLTLHTFPSPHPAHSRSMSPKRRCGLDYKWLKQSVTSIQSDCSRGFFHFCLRPSLFAPRLFTLLEQDAF